MGSVARSIIRNRQIRPVLDGDKKAKEDRSLRAEARQTAEAEVKAEIKEHGHRPGENQRARIKARYEVLCEAAGLPL